MAGSGCSIVAGDILYMLTSSGPVAAGTATANRTVTVTFSNHPTFIVTHHVTLLAQAPITLTSTSGTVGKALTLTSSGGSGTGAVTYAAAPSPGCSISSGTISATSAGTRTVTVTKAADTIYRSASSASTTVTFTAKVALVKIHAAWAHRYAVPGRTVMITIGG